MVNFSSMSYNGKVDGFLKILCKRRNLKRAPHEE